MNVVCFAKVEQTFLREIWIKFNLIDNWMNSGSGQKAFDL
jgi:hypothetical protein